jgi:hypothetical protein
VDALVREWTLTWPGGCRTTPAASVVRRFGGFDTGSDTAEPFPQALASRLGSSIPTS